MCIGACRYTTVHVRFRADILALRASGAALGARGGADGDRLSGSSAAEQWCTQTAACIKHARRLCSDSAGFPGEREAAPLSSLLCGVLLQRGQADNPTHPLGAPATSAAFVSAFLIAR